MSSRRLRIQFALSMLTVMLALWVFRLRVGYVEFNGLLLIWLAFPIAAFAVGLLLRRHAIAEAFFALNVIYCAVYSLYCLPGEEGNNLPFLFVPLLLAVFSCLFVPVAAIYGWIKRKFTKRPGHERNSLRESGPRD